jgi:large subunit ribosomal protein L22
MGKPKRERSLADTEAMAVARNLRVSPRKLNLVAGLIRGKKVDTALADLQFSRKRIAQDVRKCVMSAVANAENNHNLDVNDLVVSEAFVGKNLVMKRFAARGRGRASSIMKPFSQITVIVRQTEEDGEDKGRVKKAKVEKRPATKSASKSASKPAKGAKDTKAAKPAKAAAAKEAKAEKGAASKLKKSSKGGKTAKETE